MSHLFVRSGVVFAALVFLLASGAAFAADANAAKSAKSPETRLVGVVNVNSASSEQLGLLPGVGPVRAQAIIERRKKSGPFKQVEDLKQVSGIGDRALERIRPHVALDGKTNARLER